MQFLSKVGHGPVSSDFILEVIRVDLHCHLEVTVAQQGRFGIKSTAAQKRHGRYGQGYYRTLIGSRMCSVQWRHPRWHWNTFQGHGRRRCFPHEKLSPREIYAYNSGRQQQCPHVSSPRKTLPREQLSREILALAEVCALWLLTSWEMSTFYAQL